MHKKLAEDFTSPLISEIKVIDDPNYDCGSHKSRMVRLFDYKFAKKNLNGFPVGVTICALFDAPSWVDSSCDSDERPHVCVQNSRGGATVDEYCAKSEQQCPILSFDVY